MYRTLEMRWFLSEPPFAAERFFTIEHAQPPRVDWYAPTSHDGCGIKTREGNLETKLRTENYGRQDFAGLTGQLEQWIKWSVELPRHEQIPDSLLARTGWRAVTKHRHQRTFEVLDGKLTETSRQPDNGCEFEWTELTVAEAHWWTVGFEAFGDEGKLRENLIRVIAHLLEHDLQAGMLEHGRSCSYPQWLLSV